MHGFVREELPLVCQKCNPAVTRRDPALRGKLLRQKCVSVGAPSCLASLSVSLFLSILLTTSTSLIFFPVCSSRYIFLFHGISFAPPSIVSCPPPPGYLHVFFPFSFSLSIIVNSMHASFNINTSKTSLHHWIFTLRKSKGFLSGDRSPFSFFAPPEKINTQSPNTEALP